jgi:hypothetical protein
MLEVLAMMLTLWIVFMAVAYCIGNWISKLER